MPWTSPSHPTIKPRGCCYMVNLTPKYPGDSWILVHLKKGGEIGDVRVQFYDEHFKVAAFLPGISIFNPGDSPKTEPEFSLWTTDRAEADKQFVKYVIAAFRDGWEPMTVTGR